VREDGRMVGGEEWQEKVYDREEWKRLLRTARNHHILYVPMDWLIDWLIYWSNYPILCEPWNPFVRKYLEEVSAFIIETSKVFVIIKQIKIIFHWIKCYCLHATFKRKVKWCHYRPSVAQRVGRVITLLFHDRGTRRGWVVSSTPWLQFTPRKDPVPILQEAGWAPGPAWTYHLYKV